MLNPIEEARFTELKRMCCELKVPAPPEIMIGLKVHDKNGVLIFDDVQRGHSWTRNYWNNMAKAISGAIHSGVSFGAGYMSSKLADETISNEDPIVSLQHLNVSLVVGTSDAAFSVNDYILGAIIADGVGNGQLSRIDMPTPVTAYTVGTKTWKSTLSRIFNNNSGAPITVKETGLFPGGLSQLILLERSVLGAPVAVANAAQLTVTYEVSMDFSAID